MSQQPALSGAEGNGPTCSEGDFDLPLSQQPGAMRTPYAPHVAGRNSRYEDPYSMQKAKHFNDPVHGMFRVDPLLVAVRRVDTRRLSLSFPRTCAQQHNAEADSFPAPIQPTTHTR